MNSTDLGLHSDTLSLKKAKINSVPINSFFGNADSPNLVDDLYAGVNASVIDERPPGRTPITTRVMASERREAVIDRLAEACAEGAQAYWVCPSIDSEDGQLVSNLHSSAPKQTPGGSFGWPRARPYEQSRKTNRHARIQRRENQRPCVHDGNRGRC